MSIYSNIWRDNKFLEVCHKGHSNITSCKCWLSMKVRHKSDFQYYPNRIQNFIIKSVKLNYPLPHSMDSHMYSRSVCQPLGDQMQNKKLCFFSALQVIFVLPRAKNQTLRRTNWCRFVVTTFRAFLLSLYNA